MEKSTSDESVKAGLKIEGDTSLEKNLAEETDPLEENEKDLDEAVHEQTTLGNIENVDGENDIDDFVHKQPTPPETDMEDKEEDIDDLLHQK
jgi:hypothetical protein